MDPAPILQRILTQPAPADLLSLQGVLLSWEEKADSPLARERVSTALSLLEDFYTYLTGLESKLEAHSFAELASKMDMGAVAGVVAENVLGAGQKLLERVLVGSFSEALTVLASRQYVKAYNRELEAFFQQVAWRLRAHIWRFSAAKRPKMAPAKRAALIDSLFVPIFEKETPGSTRSIALGCLFQVLLLDAVTSMMPI